MSNPRNEVHVPRPATADLAADRGSMAVVASLLDTAEDPTSFTMCPLRSGGAKSLPSSDAMARGRPRCYGLCRGC